MDYLSGGDSAAAAAPPTSLVLAIDATLDEDLLAGLTDNLMPLLRALPATTQLILMVFDSVLAVYDLSSSIPTAVTFPGEPAAGHMRVLPTAWQWAGRSTRHLVAGSRQRTSAPTVQGWCRFAAAYMHMHMHMLLAQSCSMPLKVAGGASGCSRCSMLRTPSLAPAHHAQAPWPSPCHQQHQATSSMCYHTAAACATTQQQHVLAHMPAASISVRTSLRAPYALLLPAGTAQVAPSLVAAVLATGAVRSMPLSACLPNLPAVLDSIRPYQQHLPARERLRWGCHSRCCSCSVCSVYCMCGRHVKQSICTRCGASWRAFQRSRLLRVTAALQHSSCSCTGSTSRCNPPAGVHAAHTRQQSQHAASAGACCSHMWRLTLTPSSDNSPSRSADALVQPSTCPSTCWQRSASWALTLTCRGRQRAAH